MIYIGFSGLKIQCIRKMRLSPPRKHTGKFKATVVEQVYTTDLKSVDAGHAGSIPASRTNPQLEAYPLAERLGFLAIIWVAHIVAVLPHLIKLPTRRRSPLWERLLCAFVPFLSAWLPHRNHGAKSNPLGCRCREPPGLEICDLNTLISPLNPPKDLKILRTTSSRKNKN